MQERMVEISAIIGAVYMLARVIVVLTPTPRDDEALKKVAGWLKLAALITGLDLKRGFKKYGP